MSTDAPRPQIPLLLSAVFLVFLAQMTLNPIIAPLSREVGLAEWQIGLVISVAAMMVVATSQFWGRRSQSWGRKPVLVAAFVVATAAMALFALLAQLGMDGVVTGTVLFVLFILLRGLGFGTAIAAVPPTAQAYIADITTDERERVKGMAGVGAAQGIAMVAGAIVGGTLSVFGLIAPLIAVPALLLVGLIVVAFRLRRQDSAELIEEPARIRPTDSRVWPFLLAGFGMFTALGFVQVITGFIVQDRLSLDAETTGLVTGGALLAAGLGMVLAQAVSPAHRLGAADPAASGRFGRAVRVRRAHPECRCSAAVHRDRADRSRSGAGNARLYRRADPPRRPRRAGRSRRPHRSDERLDLRHRARRGHRPLRRVGPVAGHRRSRDHGRGRRLRAHPSALPAAPGGPCFRLTHLRTDLVTSSLSRGFSCLDQRKPAP